MHPLIELVFALAAYVIAAFWAKSAAARTGLPNWAAPALLSAASH